MLVMLESLPVALLKDLEDLDEEVDDVEVELDGGHNVLLCTQSGHNHLGNLTLRYIDYFKPSSPGCRR